MFRVDVGKYSIITWRYMEHLGSERWSYVYKVCLQKDIFEMLVVRYSDRLQIDSGILSISMEC